MVYGGVFGRRSPRLAAQYMAATPSTASTLEVFGAKPPAPVAQPNPVDQYDPLSIGQSRPVHRGAFGRIGRGIADALGGAPFVRSDGSVRQPNFLENMMYGRPALTEMMQAEQTMANAPFQRQRLKQQVAAGDAELNDAETVRSGRQRFRGTLTDPAAQAAFDVNPAPFIDAAAPPSETFSAPRIINGRLAQENERTHEVQWAPQRIGGGGVGGSGAGGAGGWSDNAIDAAATQMLENGGRVPPNLRNQAAIARVWSRYSELLNAQGRGAEGQVARQASVAASQRGLVTVRARRALMEPAERAANRELQLVQQLSTRVGLSNSPFWNRPINAWGDQAAGNPDLIAFRNAALSAATEYARVLSGSTGAGGITDSAREEAESMINVNMSPAQIVAAIETMRLGMSYKNEELLEEERQFLEDLGQAPQNGPASTALPDIRGRHAGRSNRVPTYNPATGRIE